MDDIRSRPAVTRPVTMECAGNGRALMPPRAESQPWLVEAVGNAEWTGTPLPPILEEAGLRPDAVELVFTGADHGIQGEVEQDYQWGFSLADIVRDDVLLAYELNGQPLPPQHGFPVRLLVPDWYGMCSVKWLRRITAVADPFDGFQLSAYQLRQEPDGPGERVTRKAVRALMLPPGFTDFPARQRFVDAGPAELIGRAWSGWGHIDRVEVSVDGGSHVDRRVDWDRTRSRPRRGGPGPSTGMPGRGSTSSSSVRPTTPATSSRWTRPGTTAGFMNNVPQRVPVVVRCDGSDELPELVEAAVDVLFVLKKCGLIRRPSPRKSVQTSRASSSWQIFSGLGTDLHVHDAAPRVAIPRRAYREPRLVRAGDDVVGELALPVTDRGRPDLAR